MQQFRQILLSLLIVFMAACTSNGKTYRIGIDPSWYPLELQGKEANVFAFANELLIAIGQEEGVHFERVTMGWDNLIYGLKEHQYEGMLSSLIPRLFLEKTYSFSDPILQTGPVLVVKKGEKVSSLKQMKGKEVAVSSLANEALLLDQFPQVIIQYYNSIPVALDEMLSGRYDGVLINYLQATSFLRGLYLEKFSLATPPLNDAGIRLLTLKGKNPELIHLFNRGLDKLQDNGKLDKLLKKWDLQ